MFTQGTTALLLLTSVLALTWATTDPYMPGPYEVHTMTITRLEGLALDHNLRVYAPNATGTFSVSYFFSGFGGNKTLIPSLEGF